MSLTDAELERYARHIVLPQVGGVGQRRLRDASVAVVGAGGIGSAVIPALAGAGVGQITIIDDDVVELGNLHRQPLFRERDAGYSKADLALQFVQRLNRFVKATPVQQRIDGENAREMIQGHSLVIDGSDNFATRLAVSDACVSIGMPLLSAAAVQFQGQVALFRSKPCYRCFVGDAFDAEDCDNCAELGVLGALTATVGSFAALLAINWIIGVGDDPAGKLHLFEGEKLAWREIRIPPDPRCRACGSAESAGDPRDKLPRNLFLARFRPILDTRIRNEVHAVVAAAHHVAGNVVGDDPVRALGMALGSGLIDHALGLGREAHQKPRTLRAPAKLGQNVAGRQELQLGRPAAFLEF